LIASSPKGGEECTDDDFHDLGKLGKEETKMFCEPPLLFDTLKQAVMPKIFRAKENHCKGKSRTDGGIS